ncbi:MAG TPA: 2-phospho-L-lactate guanylyltransferase [Acidimicrobiales bacterium]|nr:2-phospho-L-lactate guanylyltransferase [Acidimicrobiales bacterium]
MAPERTTQVVIPVKAFGRAKARLAPALSLTERADLARQMATGVVAAAGAARTWVVCDDREVAAWADSLGCSLSWQPGRGLNGAVAAATTERFSSGAARVVVIHSDLPLVRSLAALEADDDAIVLAPDRHNSGTNAVSTPTSAFCFAYGPGSFSRHLDEAARLDLPMSIVRDRSLGWDVDEPADLSVFGVGAGTPTPG